MENRTYLGKKDRNIYIIFNHNKTKKGGLMLQ